jgi:hypothetical protein
VLDLKQTTQESTRFNTDIFKSYIKAQENVRRHSTAEHQTEGTSLDYLSDSNTLHTDNQREEMAHQKPYQDHHKQIMSHYQKKSGEPPENLKTYSWPALDTRYMHFDEKYP